MESSTDAVLGRCGRRARGPWRGHQQARGSAAQRARLQEGPPELASQEGGQWLIVNVQRSAWTRQDDVAFTINLATSQVHDEDKPPPYYKCKPRGRIGKLL